MLFQSSKLEPAIVSMNRALNLLQRSKDANNLRCKISRAYYACYHACISAVLLEEKFDSNPSSGSPHRNIRDRYKKLYGKTSGKSIVVVRGVGKTLQLWKELRESADYEIFTRDFEDRCVIYTRKRCPVC